MSSDKSSNLKNPNATVANATAPTAGNAETSTAALKHFLEAEFVACKSAVDFTSKLQKLDKETSKPIFEWHYMVSKKEVIGGVQITSITREKMNSLEPLPAPGRYLCEVLLFPMIQPGQRRPEIFFRIISHKKIT
jgi:hypothetical protein